MDFFYKIAENFQTTAVSSQSRKMLSTQKEASLIKLRELQQFQNLMPMIHGKNTSIHLIIEEEE